MSTRSARFIGFLRMRCDQVLAPDDQPGLRAAEQLVAAEGDDVGAVRERFARRRLVRQAVVLEIDQHAAAEIDDERQLVLVRELRELRFGHRSR